MSVEPSLNLADVLRAEREALGIDPTKEPALSALCISGGGIRSATFGLGALQGLADHGLLDKFDYLSTVSGGGYIGSWMSAWVNRAKGLINVIPRLRRDASPAPSQPDPIQHLRDYNSYLTPRSGALSSDLWTVIATVLRNILLNWIVLIPMLMAALMLPRLYLSALSFPELLYGGVIFETDVPDYGAAQLNGIGESAFVELLLPLVSFVLFAFALYNTLRYLPGVGGREHTTHDYMFKVLAPLVGAVLTFLLFDSLYYLGEDYVSHVNLRSVLIWTTAPCVAAWLSYLLFHRRPLKAKLRLLFGPLSLAVAVMAAGIGLATWTATNFILWHSDPHTAPSWAEYVTIGPSIVLLGYCLGTVLFVGLSSSFLTDEDREWMSRSVGGVLLFCVAWTGICAMVLVLPQWALGWRSWAHGVMAAGAALTAWLSTLSASATANANPGAVRSQSGGARLLAVAASVAPPLFLLLLACALSIGSNVLLQGLHGLTNQTLAGPHGVPVIWTNHNGMLTRSQPILVALLAVLLLIISWVMARWVNINTFSLHGMYRDRIVRAYLGASNPVRNASPFTGFCRSDDLPIAALDPTLRPFHVVNITLNLVAGTRLAWQQRKAASFTMTPLHCGSADLGYRPSSQYAGGISLGSAVAISGAAASPNMGYHSSPVVGFIMTLFNARLGCWLGNPGAPGARTWTQPGPSFAIRSMIREALGQTTDSSEYVYLSDGGHFENLGLYEMVRRHCRLIVVLDAGGDAEFNCDDLGNALRKIRIDQNIPIAFDAESMQLLRQRKRRWATASIRYSQVEGAGEDGRLIYVKPMLLGNESPDVLSYAASNPTFPHQSTGDQWFDESQTESYRELGAFTVNEMCRGWSAGALADWCRQLDVEESKRAETARA